MKTELLHMLKNDDQSAAIKAVLLSGLLPEPQLQQWLNGLIERALRRVLGLPGCSEWTGRASWDTWAVKRLHCEDRTSQAFLKAAERVIALTTLEAQEVARNTDSLYADAPLWAAAEAARASHWEPGEPLRLHALKASWSAVRTASNAAVAAYDPRVIIVEAVRAERDQQYQDLLSLINSLPDEA